MEYIPCIGNSSYSFWRILLKIYSCFQDGLKICILFSQDPEIIFFLHFNLDIFSSLYATDMYREYMPCIGNPTYSFRPILLKLYRYFAAFLWFHMRNLSLAGYNCSGGASCMACSFIWDCDDIDAELLDLCPWTDSVSPSASCLSSASQYLSRLMTKPTKWHVRPGKTQDQPGHPPSLIRVFAVHMKKAWVLSYHWAHSEDWSDWADAQADLSLRWAHRSFCWFCHETAHFIENSIHVYLFDPLVFISCVISSKAPLL